MYTWDHIVQFSKNPRGRLYRLSNVEDAYKEYQQTHTSDQLSSELFDNNDKPFVYRQNDFPYNIDKNIQHMVVWIRPGFTVEQAIENIIDKYKDDTVTYFVNETSAQSIPSIKHIQLFIRVNNA